MNEGKDAKWVEKEIGEKEKLGKENKEMENENNRGNYGSMDNIKNNNKTPHQIDEKYTSKLSTVSETKEIESLNRIPSIEENELNIQDIEINQPKIEIITSAKDTKNITKYKEESRSNINELIQEQNKQVLDYNAKLTIAEQKENEIIIQKCKGNLF